MTNPFDDDVEPGLDHELDDDLELDFLSDGDREVDLIDVDQLD